MGYPDLKPDELCLRAEKAVAMLEDCQVCAQNCHVNRLEGELGVCRGGREAAVSSWGPHFGEEDVLVGNGGSGTIFFSRCNLTCRFCQNCELSQYDEGREVSSRELADIMLELQESGCHNVNLVSPSHYVPQILEALVFAARDGLKIPLVYNTGTYDSLETLQLLDGIVDIYMPDIKFGNDEIGEKYTGGAAYFTVARAAVKEMHRQVGDLTVDERGVAARGVLVRHLVMPNNLSGTDAVMNFLAEEVSANTFINIMDQYYPAHEALNFSELSRRISSEEFQEAIGIAHRAGLKRIMP